MKKLAVRLVDVVVDVSETPSIGVAGLFTTITRTTSMATSTAAADNAIAKQRVGFRSDCLGCGL